MDEQPPWNSLRDLGYTGDPAIAIFPPFLLHDISTYLTMACHPEDGIDLSTQYRDQFIEDHRDELGVDRMCKMLDVSRSGYYAWRGRPPSKREMANRQLYKEIKAVYDSAHETYGSPRVHQELKRQGIACSENRVARLKRLRGLRARQRRIY